MSKYGIPSYFYNMFDESAAGTITTQEPQTNATFGFTDFDSEYTEDYDGDGLQVGGWTSKAVSGDAGTNGVMDMDDVDGGIVALIENIGSIINDILGEGFDEDDIAQIIIGLDDDGEYFESEFMPIGDIEDNIDEQTADYENYYNRWFSTQNQSYLYGSKSVNIKIRVVQNEFKGSRYKPTIKSKTDFKTKKSIIMVKNEDELCLGRCLVIAIAMRDKNPKLKQIKMGRNIQGELAIQLYKDAGIEAKHSSLPIIKEFEAYLDCSITIIDCNKFNNVIYPVIQDSDYEVKDFNIYLLKDGQHFHLINNKQVAGFFAKDYFCDKCKKTFKNKDKHKCPYKCNICCKEGCCGKKPEDKKWISCKDCWRFFPNQECFNNHKSVEEITTGINKGQSKKSVCEKIFKCPTCKKFYDKEKFNMSEHRCGDTWCKNCDCKINENDGHKCYMMPKKIKDTDTNYIFFDFECSQNTGRHEVNYCIAQYYDDPTPIEFFDLDSFMTWLLLDKHKGYSVLAHNGRGYDFQFIMEYIYQKTIFKPVVVYAGSKIMILTIKEMKLRFVDSLNFLTMPLASFPKTFGLKELKKGFFPHYYNTAENYYYEGKIPALRHFGYNNMSEKKREELIKFWVVKRATNYKWSQYDEMKAYCISDVDILRRSCIIFRELYLEICDIDPFKYTTIASVCMAIFKGKFLCPDVDIDDKLDIRNKVFEEEKIAIVPFKQQEFIRKSFFGGRTNSIKLKYEFKRGEIGVYSDITSLYPSVNYYDEYPIGHPIEITENFGDPTKYFGFIDCYVECPKDLYFPVLANKGEKLLFDLVDKRGVWTTIELNKAVEMGYKIKTIYKVLHYKKRSNNIFKGYVSTFLKIKQEASGFPAWVSSAADKDKYIKDYEDRQGIKLDKEKIGFNAGLRAIAKLCLNSLWGKFGQRLNMPKNEIISDKNSFNKIMFSDKFTGQAWNMIDDERMEIRYKSKDEFIDDDYNTNIAVASFTTSHARLRLYWALERLNKQVLYHDTDSVVYVYDKNNPKHFRITNGDLLGEWTDELDGVDMCGTFLGAGPKNYSYETTDGELHTKIKGFTLDYDATREGKLTHKNMEVMIDNRDNKELKVPVKYNMICRNKKTKILTTKPQTKNYGFCYTKREILEEVDGVLDTIPFGYIAPIDGSE